MKRLSLIILSSILSASMLVPAAAADDSIVVEEAENIVAVEDSDNFTEIDIVNEEAATPSKGGSSFSSAYELPLNTYFSDHLINYEGTTYYKVIIKENGFINFDELNDEKKNGAWKFTLYNGDHESLMSFDFNAGVITKQSTAIFGVEPGEYFVVAETAHGILGSPMWTNGDFNIKVNYTPTDDVEHEKNDTYDTSNEIVTDTIYNASLHTDKDYDFFTFTPDKSGNYQFIYKSEKDTIVRIQVSYQDRKAMLLKDIQSYSDDNILQLEAGTKYYLIYTVSYYGSTIPSYTFSVKYNHEHSYVSSIKKQPSYSKPGIRVFTCECGDSYEEAIDKLVLKKVSLNKVSRASGRKAKILWSRNKKASGYEVQYSPDKSFKKKVSTMKITKNSITSKTTPKLIRNRKYYVRVRAYVVEEGKKYYSGWSSKKNITIK